MNAKSLVAAGLLLFAAAAVAALVVREYRGGAAPAGARQAGDPPEAGEAAGGGDRVVVYYFHMTERCATCNKMEAYSHEALQSGFAEALRDGRLQWQTVDYQRPENEHYQEEFKFNTPTVVVAEIRGGKPARFEELDRVWMLVADREEFIAYVKDGVGAFLKG